MLSSFLLASAMAVQLSNCVPARWPSVARESLALLDDSPISCLLLDSEMWKSDFLGAARERRLTLLGVIEGEDTGQKAKQAVDRGLDGLVLEGNLPAEQLEAVRTIARKFGKPLVELPLRSNMTFDPDRQVTGTIQGLWPGVKVETDGAAHSGPTGAPWIDTNTGFLRFARASLPQSTAVWIANRPPEKTVLGAQNYIQAIGDAALSGTRWVLALDRGFADLLLKGDAHTLDAWRRINGLLQFYEQHSELWKLPDYSGLAVVQDVNSGALVSGGMLDMIASQHTPVSITPTGRLDSASFAGVKMLLNIDPAGLTPKHQEKVTSAARRGATVMNGPAGWKITLPAGDRITYAEEEIKKLDEVWKDINTIIGRRNFAVRLFGAPSMRSNLKGSPERGKLALHLVNYSGYPVEAITVHVAGKWAKATLLTPQGERPAERYNVDEGTGVDIDRIADIGILLLEP